MAYLQRISYGNPSFPWKRES